MGPAARCKDAAKKMPLKREKQSLIKEEAPIRVCVPRHSVGGDGEIRTLELVSELHDFQSCALDRTRRHLRIGLITVAYHDKNYYNSYSLKNQVFFLKIKPQIVFITIIIYFIIYLDF